MTQSMSKLANVKGHCLCGAVEITVKKMKPTICACHCHSCRRWSGGPLLSVDCGTEVVFSNNEAISYFKSSDWAKRGFCKHCGSHIFYLFTAEKKYFMPIGLFEQNNAMVLDHQIFIEEKPPYYCFANETINMTGAEVDQQFLKK